LKIPALAYELKICAQTDQMLQFPS